MTGPTRRRRMPRAQREQQMLEVAEAVFAERGFAAASMDEIAERVGVSKPMLYEYFHSKEGLLLACVAQARAELREVTERAVEGSTDARAALRSGLRAFFVFARERRQGWSLLRHELALIGTSASEALEATRRQQTDLIAKLMARLLRCRGGSAGARRRGRTGGGRERAPGDLVRKARRGDTRSGDGSRHGSAVVRPGSSRSVIRRLRSWLLHLVVTHRTFPPRTCHAEFC